MRLLWRKTSDLFWQYPVLWLPVLAADFAGFCLKQFCEFLRNEAIRQLMQQRPALGNMPEYTHGAMYTGGVVLLGVFRSSESYFTICFYTAAMLITAALLQAAVQGYRPGWRSITIDLKKRPSIFVFSAKVFLLCVLAVVIEFQAVVFLPRVDHIPPFYGISASSPGVLVFAVVLFAGVAYIIAPSAIRILRSQNEPAIQSSRFMSGRMLAALTVVASSAIDYFMGTVEQAIFRNVEHVNSIELQAIYACASLISAFPYVFLFIALSLVANGETEARQEITESA